VPRTFCATGSNLGDASNLFQQVVDTLTASIRCPKNAGHGERLKQAPRDLVKIPSVLIDSMTDQTDG
jgi:hypothetical protein